MLRSFRLRDFQLLTRLSESSVPLNASLILTYPSAPVRGAILHRILRQNYPTYIWRADRSDARAFVQLRIGQDPSQAHVLWLGTQLGQATRDSAEASYTTSWQMLFEELSVELANRGVHSLIVEARENSDESRILRKIGFAAYARQEIWKLAPGIGRTAELPSRFQLRTSKDDWNIDKLYAHIVPNMIRMIEPKASDSTGGWVCYEGNDLSAYGMAEVGDAANWLRLFVKLDATVDANELVKDAVSYQHAQHDQPIYCCIRQYQSWLGNALRHNQFELFDSQVVMVRQTVQAIQRPVSGLEAVLKSNGAAANTSPLIHKHKTGEENKKTLAKQ